MIIADSRYDPRESPREARFSSRSERTPQELPTSPPYTAHLGNLPFDLTEEQVKKFFFESKVNTKSYMKFLYELGI
jgi:translation initiation factor 4B